MLAFRGIATSSFRQRLLAAAVLAVTLGLVDATSAAAAPKDTAKWCALVIKINTAGGYMRNKHYGKLTPQIFKAVIVAGEGYGGQLIAAAPKSIKKATTDEAAWLARVKANNYNPATPGGSFTAAEAHQLIQFQHTYCGITGP